MLFFLIRLVNLKAAQRHISGESDIFRSRGRLKGKVISDHGRGSFSKFNLGTPMESCFLNRIRPNLNQLGIRSSME